MFRCVSSLEKFWNVEMCKGLTTCQLNSKKKKKSGVAPDKMLFSIQNY